MESALESITLENMTRDERNLLLYFETRMVDYSGTIDSAHVNASDIEIAQKWNEIGFIKYGRIAFKCLPLPSDSGKGRLTTCCFLSDHAWKLAHQERYARYQRNYEKRKWLTAEEYREV